MRAQVAVEYLLIVGVALLILLPLFYYAITYSNLTIKLNQANDAVNVLAKTADKVYSLGPGTRDYVFITIPYGVEGILIDDSRVMLRLRVSSGVSDIYADTKGNVTGVLPIGQGTYKVKVEMLESGVVFIERE